MISNLPSSDQPEHGADRNQPPDGRPRNYPIPMPEGDSRFDFDLVFDVGRVLEQHGYPPLASSADVVELQALLYRFIYLGEESL